MSIYDLEGFRLRVEGHPSSITLQTINISVFLPIILSSGIVTTPRFYVSRLKVESSSETLKGTSKNTGSTVSVEDRVGTVSYLQRTYLLERV